MLSVEGLNQAYGESQILWDMQLDVPEGSSTCLMGRNGVGKTTLLRVVMGTPENAQRQGAISPARTSPVVPRSSARGAASASSRRVARFFRSSPFARISSSACSRAGASAPCPSA